MPIIIPSTSWEQREAIIKVIDVHTVVQIVLSVVAARDIFIGVILHAKQSITTVIVIIAVTVTTLKRHQRRVRGATNVVEWGGGIWIRRLTDNLLGENVLCGVDKDLKENDLNQIMW